MSARHFQTVRHYNTTVKPIHIYKSGMLPILPRHLNLMKTRVSIQEGQEVAPRGRIHDLIYSWKWIWVLGTGLIKVGIVDAHLKLPISLGNDDWIGQPYWVMDLFDEASAQ
jgi:hypothetical protein